MIHFAVLTAAFLLLNPFWSRKLPIIAASQKLTLLQPLPFSSFDFPRWQAVFAVSLVGFMAGLDPMLRTTPPNGPGATIWLALPVGLAATWAAFLVTVRVLHWWMKRGAKWDGQGDLFNLVAASWLVMDTLTAGLTAVGVPPLLTLPLWVYAIWVGVHAISKALPSATLAYSTVGVLIALAPAMLAFGIVIALSGVASGLLGAAPAGDL